MSSSPSFQPGPRTNQPPAGTYRPRSESALAVIDLAGASHPGKVRLRNEDHFLVARVGRFLETVQTNLPAEDMDARYAETGYGMVTADGLGGHAAGDQASRLAINVLMNLVLATPDWILRLDDDADADRLVERAQERFELISRAMSYEAAGNLRLQGFGTTLTLATSLGNKLFVFYAGDSRAYLLRRNKLHQLTRDHTVGQHMLDAGLIQQEDLVTHRWRNKLTKRLGDQANDFHPDVMRVVLQAGDCLLLCTDGLTDMVDDAVIAEVLGRSQPAKEVCQDLIDKALEAGGVDNITVIVTRYESFGEATVA